MRKVFRKGVAGLLAALLFCSSALNIPGSKDTSIAKLASAEVTGNELKVTIPTGEGVLPYVEYRREVPYQKRPLVNSNTSFLENRSIYSSQSGYQALSAKLQQAYDYLYAGCVVIDNGMQDAFKYENLYFLPDIGIPEEINLLVSETSDLISAFAADNPQFFWFGHGNLNNTYQGSDVVIAVNIMVDDTWTDMMTGSSRQQMKTTIFNEVNSFLATITTESAYSAEKKIHDYLCIKKVYSFDDYAHSIAGAFIEGEGIVCEAYAKAFQLLCNAAGIEATYVSGQAVQYDSESSTYKDAGGHGWNQVKLGGEWYNVDVTWDDIADPSIMRGSEYYYLHFNVKDLGNTYFHTFPDNSTYTYSNRDFISEGSADQEHQLHKATSIIPTQVCTATKYSYANHSTNNKTAAQVMEAVSAPRYNCMFTTNLGLMYAVDKAQLDGFKDIKLEVTKNLYQGYDLVGTDMQILTPTITDIEGKDYYLFSYNNIAACEVGDNLSAKLTATRNGIPYEKNFGDYSILKYCETQLDSGTSNMKKLVVDLLNYCAAAQDYFAYRTNSPVTSSPIVSSNQALAGSSCKIIPRFQKKANNSENKKINSVYANVFFDNSIKAAFSFDLGELEKNSVSVKVEYEAGIENLRSVVIPASQFISLGSTQYYFTFDNFDFSQLDKTFTVTVMQGETAISDTYTYSISTYVKDRMDHSEKTTFKTLLIKLMIFGESAQAYVSQ